MAGEAVLRVSIGSIGTIGLKVAQVIDTGGIPGLALGAVPHAVRPSVERGGTVKGCDCDQSSSAGAPA